MKIDVNKIYELAKIKPRGDALRTQAMLEAAAADADKALEGIPPYEGMPDTGAQLRPDEVRPSALPRADILIERMIADE